MSDTKRMFPLFENKFEIMRALKDEQRLMLFNLILCFEDDETRDTLIQQADDMVKSVYGLLINDLGQYDDFCERTRELNRKRQERYRQMAKEKADTKQPEQPKQPKPEKKAPEKYADEISEIIEYLNRELGSHYRTNSKATVKHIKARLSEGHTVGDFKVVISKMKRVWTGTEFEKFLRPETLFNSEKFEGYLNRTEKTDTELKQQQRFADNYGWMEEWARKGDEADEQAGVYADSGNDRGYLPEFSAEAK